MTASLAGKVAVITGGTRGLGLAIARAFAAEGAAVVVSSRSAASVERAVAELGGRVSGVRCDVSDPAQVSSLAAYALQHHGRFDLWVNNAGTSAPYGPTFSVPVDEFALVVRTNILGVYYGSRAALDHFLPRRSGKLINVLGRGARGPAPMQNAYGASKAWNRSFTASLAKEYAGTGVGIHAFSPGMVRTEMLLRPTVLAGHEQRLGGFYQTVLRMWANPADVPARRAVWLAGPATDGRTGLDVEVMGPGMMLAGAGRELLARLTGRVRPVDVQITSVPPVDFGPPTSEGGGR